MNRLTQIEEYNLLIEQYLAKGYKTNNYLLPNSLYTLLDNRQVYYQLFDSNLLFFVDRKISYQVYFHINNLEANLSINCDKPLMMEMVYRGIANRPNELLSFWNIHEFKTHLTRNEMEMNIFQKRNIEDLNKKITVKIADSIEEAKFTTSLFEKDLDKYTGDLKSFEEICVFMNHGNIICAYEGTDLCGALQFEIKQGTCWLGHIAVDSAYRGKGVAAQLVESYISINQLNNINRYRLWVIEDNIPANKLYQKFGFNKTGKFTVSMIKL